MIFSILQSGEAQEYKSLSHGQRRSAGSTHVIEVPRRLHAGLSRVIFALHGFHAQFGLSKFIQKKDRVQVLDVCRTYF